MSTNYQAKYSEKFVSFFDRPKSKTARKKKTRNVGLHNTDDVIDFCARVLLIPPSFRH